MVSLRCFSWCDKRLKGHPGRGQRMHVHVGNSLWNQHGQWAPGKAGCGSVQSEKEGFRRDQALQMSSRNQLLRIGNGKETDPCDCVVQFLLFTGSFTP